MKKKNDKKSEDKKVSFWTKLNGWISLKLLTWVMLILSSICLLSNAYSFFKTGFIDFSVIVSILGIVSSVLLFKRIKFGWYLSLIWCAVQILVLRIGYVFIRLAQIFDFTLKLDLMPDLNLMIGINVLAILLGYLFLMKRKEFTLKKK